MLLMLEQGSQTLLKTLQKYNYFIQREQPSPIHLNIYFYITIKVLISCCCRNSSLNFEARCNDETTSPYINRLKFPLYEPHWLKTIRLLHFICL